MSNLRHLLSSIQRGGGVGGGGRVRVIFVICCL